ncbi:unnamed protein product [Didymodactylos carnosus]|uniref:Uncharacterized protein n=1 Tax=Didymodactylos carnosus TaxID=1234261 RepID=A0A814N5B0_9BILA|nr:unnamed protein product [Didymodactylos carnosus]CAF1562674.1 unnamed protein product [Didymodactylos carnosus]CAF3853066.1 unnamed protein product [Didymodactylos carnosus]CAF4354885.1 unnamed protein product [Didymodactylos carnosus]
MHGRSKLFSNEQPLSRDAILPEPSKFYLACRDGDIRTVKNLLPTIPYEQLNRLEPNGNTLLHAATQYGHMEIVRLLLHECGCQRHEKNVKGLTAYEVAKTDDMRELYHRPSDRNRFADESDESKEAFQIVSSATDTKEMDKTDENNDDENNIESDKPAHQWLNGFETHEEIQKQLVGLSGAKQSFPHL